MLLVQAGYLAGPPIRCHRRKAKATDHGGALLLQVLQERFFLQQGEPVGFLDRVVVRLAMRAVVLVSTMFLSDVFVAGGPPGVDVFLRGPAGLRPLVEDGVGCLDGVGIVVPSPGIPPVGVDISRP